MSLNINLDKCDPKVVAKYITHYELKVTGGLNAQVNAIEKHTKASVPESDLSSACSVCGGESDFNLPECPYCGAVETGDTPSTMSKAAGANGADPGDTDPHSGTDEDDEEDDDEETDAKSEAPKPKQKMGRPKPTKKPKSEKKKPTEIVETHGAELVESKALDDAVDRVQQALRQGASSYWDLGTALLEIFDKQLWKQRIAGGRQAFTSWNTFCRDELKMSHVNTFSIMDAARAFSKKDFEDIGHSKLQLMLKLPPERQQLLLEEAKQGRLPRSRLKEIIEGEVPKGHVRETGRRKPKGTAAAAAANREQAAARRVRPDGEVTAVSQLGRVKLKLWARPSAKKPNAKPVRAVSVTHDPWCEEKLVNGVVVRYAVVKTATGLELIIERRRGE